QDLRSEVRRSEFCIIMGREPELADVPPAGAMPCVARHFACPWHPSQIRRTEQFGNPEGRNRVTGLAEGTRFAEARNRMAAEQIVARGVKDPLVLQAMRTVPRHEFVPQELRDAAYRDSPLPIGDD